MLLSYNSLNRFCSLCCSASKDALSIIIFLAWTADAEASEPETVKVQAAEPIEEQKTEPKPAEVSVPVSEPVKPKRKTILILSICLVAFVIVLLIAFAVVGRLCPDWIDQFLYSPEELKILNYPL